MMWRVTIHRSDVRSDGCVRHTDAAARLPGHSARQRLDLMREQRLEPRRARTHTRAALREVDAAGSDLDGAGRKAGPAQQHAIGPMRDAVHNHRGNVESKPERKHRATVARARRRGAGPTPGLHEERKTRPAPGHVTCHDSPWVSGPTAACGTLRAMPLDPIVSLTVAIAEAPGGLNAVALVGGAP
jgi:hypothetical protein